ncbi:DUF6680 family protein [uncultured Desulfovibrio sp.]|uniref:DUF6680 family protein n=1 Tax=uncultured Desulfovibrio sp. TaxID=167968 RepID=UPI002633DD33|nr:DUF6680 family protein [uncultured Desulfovibrio sp.]
MDTSAQVTNYTSYILITINILAIALSPIIANMISIKMNQRNEKRNEKLKILRILMMTRMNRACIDYANALNLIDIVFYDSKNVRQSYKDLLDMYYKGNVTDAEFNTKNLKLIESIIKDIGYSKKINWDEISLPYAPQWYFRELEKSEENKKITFLIGQFLNTFMHTQQSTSSNEQPNQDNHA